MDSTFHISKVHLSGYRTIKDVNVDFVPGLNIIIGNNGVGKSNFLRFLHAALNLDIDNYSNLDCLYQWEDSTEFEKWHIEKNIIKENDSQLKNELSINVKDRFADEKFNSQKEVRDVRGVRNYFFSDYLPHTIHTEDLFFLTKPFETKSVLELFNQYQNRNDLPYFLKALLVRLTFHLNQFSKTPELRFNIENLINFTGFSLVLEQISVIKEFRFRSDFEVRVVDSRIEIQNLQFEFLVDENWISYNDLSDGTKRLFNIIMDTDFDLRYVTGKGFWGIGDANRTLLIEEPELGIHPHQLYKLMRFIKEQSKTKQIIITTHSPEVLDILGKDDLDRIILADYTNEKGTQLRHLSEVEKKDATTFLENVAFLSDYWKHSTLEAR